MKNKIVMTFTLLATAFAWAGNSVNNGGNLLPGQQIPTAVIVDVLSKIRLDSRLHLNYIDVKAADGPQIGDDIRVIPSIYTELLDQPLSIFQEFKNTRVEMKLDGPCLDEQGVESDASSIGSTPDSICISVPRLQSKVSRSDLWHQVLALATHEYAHRVGFNEQKATELQQAILDMVSPYARMNAEKIIQSFIYRFTTIQSSAQESLQFLQEPNLEVEHIQGGIPYRVAGDYYINLDPYWMLIMTPHNDNYDDTTFPPPFSGLNVDEYLQQESTQDLKGNLYFGFCSIIDPLDLCMKDLKSRFPSQTLVHQDYLANYRNAYLATFNGFGFEMPTHLVRPRLFGHGDCDYSLILCDSKANASMISTLSDVRLELQRFYDRVTSHKNDLISMLDSN